MSTGWPHIFATQYPTVALQYLDDQFNTLANATTSTTSLSGASLVGFVADGAGALPTDENTRGRLTRYVTDYGAIPNNSTDNTANFATAVAATPVGGRLIVPVTPSGNIYLGSFSIRRSDMTLVIEDAVTVKLPNNTNYAAAVELGDTASGNTAAPYVNLNVIIDGWLDGNSSGITTPVNDLTGHAFAATNISKSYWRVKSKNAYNAGFGMFINSNYNRFDAYVESCGNASFTGPGFDINACAYSSGQFVSNGCYAGGRILNNCFGLNVRGAVYNSTKDGFIYNNATVNSSYANSIDVTVYTAGQHGVNIGDNCTRSNIMAVVYNATGIGMVIGTDASFGSTNNNIILATSNSGQQGLLMKTGADDNIIIHQSYLDGRSGAQGAVFAIDVSSNRNKLTVDLIDSSTWQVRGIAIRSGATDNEILSYTYTNTADPWSDSGTRTKANHGNGLGTNLTAAATISPTYFGGNKFFIDGGTGISAITASGNNGRQVTFIFNNTCTVTAGATLLLAGNFGSTSNDSLTLMCNGTSWYELSRSVN